MIYGSYVAGNHAIIVAIEVREAKTVLVKIQQERISV
jgi:hypothetical protein